MIIYLYVKTHNVTGLKYLGMTKKSDPFSYNGSGIYWRHHLRVHGYDFSTEILQVCSSYEEVQKWGLYYSHLWNIVESNEWANLTEEQGQGKNVISSQGRKRLSENAKGKTYEERYGEEKGHMMREKLRNRFISDETKKRMSEGKKGKKTGERHKDFKGWYITPWGEYSSSKAAAENAEFSLSEFTIRNWCFDLNNKPLTNHTKSRFSFFNDDDLGKTFNELGFGFRDKQDKK